MKNLIYVIFIVLLLSSEVLSSGESLSYSFGNTNRLAGSENFEAASGDNAPWIFRSEDSLISQVNAVIRIIRKKISEAERSAIYVSASLSSVLSFLLLAFLSLYRQEYISEFIQQWFSTIFFIHNKDGQKRHLVFYIQ